MLGQGFDQIAPTRNDPGLRSAQQLVAAEHHQIDPSLQAGLNGRLAGDTEGRQIHQGAAAQIFDQQQASGMGEGGQVLQARRAGKAGNTEIAGMGAQDHPRLCVIGQGLIIVAQVRSVGGPDFHHLRTTLGHNIGHPEAATDLHQLPARHDHRGSGPQRRQS